MFRTSTLFQRPTKERQGLCTRDVEANPSCCLFCFPLHFVSNPPLSGHHHHLSNVDPPSLGLYSPPGRVSTLRMGWGTGEKGWPLIKWGLIPPIPPPPHSVTPPLAQQCQRCWRMVVDWPPKVSHLPEKFYLFSLCSFQNKLFQRTSHLSWFLIFHWPHINADMHSVKDSASYKWKVEFIRHSDFKQALPIHKSFLSKWSKSLITHNANIDKSQGRRKSKRNTFTV